MPLGLFKSKPKTPAEQALEQARNLLDTAQKQAGQARSAAGTLVSDAQGQGEKAIGALGDAAHAGRQQALANLNTAATTLRDMADHTPKRSVVPILGLVLAGAAIGVGAWLLLDPKEGERRRAMVKDYGSMAKDFGQSFGEWAVAKARREL